VPPPTLVLLVLLVPPPTVPLVSLVSLVLLVPGAIHSCRLWREENNRKIYT
jgi:hypothetical protein